MSDRPLGNDAMYVTRSEFVSLQLKMDLVLRRLGINGSNNGASQVSSDEITVIDELNPSCSTLSIASSMNDSGPFDQVLVNQEKIIQKLEEVQSEIQDLKNVPRDQESEQSAAGTKEKGSITQHTLTLQIRNVMNQVDWQEFKSELCSFPGLPGFAYFLVAEFQTSAVFFYLCQVPEDSTNPVFHRPGFFSNLHLKAVLEISVAKNKRSSLSYKQIVVGKVNERWNLGRIDFSDATEKRYIRNDAMEVHCLLTCVD